MNAMRSILELSEEPTAAPMPPITTKTTKDSGQPTAQAEPSAATTQTHEKAKKCYMCIANLKGLKDKERRKRKAKGNLNFVKFLCIESQRNACMTHRYGDKCLHSSTAHVTVL